MQPSQMTQNQHIPHPLDDTKGFMNKLKTEGPIKNSDVLKSNGEGLKPENLGSQFSKESDVSEVVSNQKPSTNLEYTPRTPWKMAEPTTSNRDSASLRDIPQDDLSRETVDDQVYSSDIPKLSPSAQLYKSGSQDGSEMPIESPVRIASEQQEASISSQQADISALDSNQGSAPLGDVSQDDLSRETVDCLDSNQNGTLFQNSTLNHLNQETVDRQAYPAAPLDQLDNQMGPLKGPGSLGSTQLDIKDKVSQLPTDQPQAHSESTLFIGPQELQVTSVSVDHPDVPKLELNDDSKSKYIPELFHQRTPISTGKQPEVNPNALGFWKGPDAKLSIEEKVSFTKMIDRQQYAPETDEKVFPLLNRTSTNSSTCPEAFKLVEKRQATLESTLNTTKPGNISDNLSIDSIVVPSGQADLDNVLNTTKSGNGSFVQPISQQELPTESGWASALKSYASQLYNTPLYFYLFCATVSILAIGFAVVHCRRHKTHRKLWASIVSYFRTSWPECREKAGHVLSEKYQEGFVFTCVATLCLLWHMLLDLGVAPVFYLFGGILYPKFARFVTLCSDLVLSRTSPKPKRLFPHVMNIKVDGRRFGRNGKYVGYQNFDMMNGGHQ